MDGMTGGYHSFRAMDNNYRILDNRCNDELVGTAGGPDEGSRAVALLVFRLELFVMMPICLLAFLALRRRSSTAPALELVASILQLLGTVFFIGPELMTGCKNMVPFGVKPNGCAPPPLDSLWNAFYWHFGIGVNIVWILVPLWLGARAAVDASSGAAILLAHRAGAAARGREMMSKPRKNPGHTKVA